MTTINSIKYICNLVVANSWFGIVVTVNTISGTISDNIIADFNDIIANKYVPRALSGGLGWAIRDYFYSGRGVVVELPADSCSRYAGLIRSRVPINL